MQCIQMDDFDCLLVRVEKLIAKTPKLKEEMLTEAGASLQGTVAGNIAAAGFRDGGRYLQAHQASHIGSGLGYVAVRAVGGKEGYPTGPNGPGAITNYNEHGHVIPQPRTEKRNGYIYRPRVKVLRVDGRHFYTTADGPSQRAAQAAVDRFAQKVVAEMEGQA